MWQEGVEPRCLTKYSHLIGTMVNSHCQLDWYKKYQGLETGVSGKKFLKKASLRRNTHPEPLKWATPTGRGLMPQVGVQYCIKVRMSPSASILLSAAYSVQMYKVPSVASAYLSPR